MSERKIVKYTIISNNFSDYMADKVNEYIKKGWQPIGGICFQRDFNDLTKDIEWYYQQAMVKYEEKKHPSNTITPIERNQYDEESRN